MSERHQSMRTILIPQKKSYKAGDFINLSKEHTRHLVQVLRLEWGTPIRVCDGFGSTFSGILEQRSSVGVLIQKLEIKETRKLEVTLHIGFAKNNTIDRVIEKAAECGITRVQPVVTSRSVVRPKSVEGEKYLSRWQKTADEACEQSERAFQMQVLPPLEWKKWIQQVTDSQSRKFAFVSETRALKNGDEQIQDTWSALKNEPSKDIEIIIGPEGGFSVAELEELKSIHFSFSSLGSKVYKVETACVVASTLVQLSTII